MGRISLLNYPTSKWPDPMLKRNDLAKQFELVTQQEIKNYQDSLNYVLQSLRDLKTEIDLFRQESKQNHASLHSMQGRMSQDIDEIRLDFAIMKIDYDNQLYDQRKVNERNHVEMLDISDAIHRKIKHDSYFDQNVKDLKVYFNEVQQHSLDTRSLLLQKTDDLLCRFVRKIEQTKREILDAPTEASLVRNEMDEKIAAHKVDVSGIMRELLMFKKENVIVEKKLENIYTLIDRIQKKENK